MSILFLSAAMAFVAGFAIKRGNICAVAAMHQWVVHRNTHHLRALVIGTCCSGVILTALAWGFPDTASVSAEYAVTSATILAGVLFGAGAWLNRACVLGTIAYLCKGDLNYMGTLLGMFFGGFIGQYAYKPLLTSGVSPLQMPTMLAAGIVCVYGFVLFLGVWKHFHSQRVDDKPHSIHLRSHDLLPMIIVVGACCAALHALNGEWTYLAALMRVAENVTTNIDKPLGPILIYSIATFSGGLLAERCRGKIKIRVPVPGLLAQRLIGGMAMGLAACMIPGGNESMMFSGVPSLLPHAIIAYVAMALTLLIMTRAFRR